MTDDYIISKIIDRIQNKRGNFEIGYLLKDITLLERSKEYHLIKDRILRRMKKEEIVDFICNDTSICSNNKTYQIIEMGGYLKYLNKEQEKIEEKNKDLQIARESTETLLKLNKWLLKTRWLSIIAIIISIISLFFSIKLLLLR